jgi:plasmid stabilization system protein ParE
MIRAILSPRAQADLEQIGRRIAQRNLAFAKQWVAQRHATCKVIASFPGCGKQCDEWLPGVRCFMAGCYAIYFKGRDPLRILRIVHETMDEELLVYEHMS